MITKKTAIGSQTTEIRYLYDSLDRLVSESRVAGGTTSSSSYFYDLAGNRTGKLEDGIYTTYTLGTGNRLASTSSSATNLLLVSGSANELIGTDPRWGALWITNLTAGTSGELNVNGKSFFASLPGTTGQTNRIHVAIRDQAGNMGYAVEDYYVGTNAATTSSSSYQYNAAGCLTNLNGTSLKWDERYRLTKFVVPPSGGSVECKYDVLGRRISRTEIPPQGGTTNVEHYVYNGDQIVADLDGSGNLLRSYVWGTGIDNLLSFTDHTTSNTYYAIKDHQNSVIALVDEDGAVVESYEYSAYGEILDVKDGSGNSIADQKSAIGNRYTFQGREIDWNTGLYYFRARWYDPDTGRWLSKDPIGIAGGLNLYEFCDSNPVNVVDPFGEMGRTPSYQRNGYNNAYDAARGAFNELRGRGLDSPGNNEWGGFVLKDKGGDYYYKAPTEGPSNSEWKGTLWFLPYGHTIIGTYHIHPGGSKTFGPTDRQKGKGLVFMLPSGKKGRVWYPGLSDQGKCIE